MAKHKQELHGEQFDEISDYTDITFFFLQQSSWKKIRNIVHWSPFIQQFKKNRYPWIQLAGHQGKNNYHIVSLRVSICFENMLEEDHCFDIWLKKFDFSGNFQAGEPGAVLKKYDSREQKAFVKLMKDVLRSYVPEYRGDVLKNNDSILLCLNHCLTLWTPKWKWYTIIA